jgi:hypothetical protein
MRDLLVRRPQQRTLTFSERDLWQTLTTPVRQQCRELVGQLLRAVLRAEASTRSDDDRENSDRPS